MSAYNGTAPNGIKPVRSRIGIHLDGLAAFLRRQHSSCTSAHVEAATGIPARTVEGWLELRSYPSLAAFLTLTHHYGPSLLAAVYPRAPRWLDEATRAERIRALEDQKASIEAEMRQLTDQ